MNLKIGTKVFHKTFGEGVILNLYSDYADVNFYKFGKKSIIYRVLSETPFETEPTKEVIANKPCTTEIQKQTRCIINKYTNLQIVETMISQMEHIKCKRIKTNEAIKFIQSTLSYDLTNNDVKKSLDSNDDYVFLKHIKKFAKKIKGKKAPLETFKFEKILKEEPTNIPAKEEPNEVDKKIITIDDFVDASMREPFYSSCKLFFARSIIRFAQYNTKKEDQIIFNLDDIAREMLNSFLYQISVGVFKNNSYGNQPPFYDQVKESVEDNHLSKEEENDLLSSVQNYLRDNIIQQFLILDGKISKDIYKIDENGNLIFDYQFIKLLEKDSASLDRRILSRLTYFINKLNENSNQVKAYSKSLFNGLDRKEFVLKFEYDENLDELKEDLVEDLYLKNDFKQLMKKHGIPSTEQYLKMCLDRLDYSLKTKRIILKAKYSNLKSYYKEKICDEEIYRYSNPLNLDEYDTALKYLMNDLYLIEVGNGVYLTRKNMEKNGIDEDKINEFHSLVERFGHKMSFFSLTELKEELNENIIIDYCRMDDGQLLQFINPIKNIKIIHLGKKDVILSFSSSKYYRGEFVKFLVSNQESADIYDIQDFVKEAFGVEYPIEELIKDIGQTEFYYSEEMEKIYKSKETYIKEVYYDGN